MTRENFHHHKMSCLGLILLVVSHATWTKCIAPHPSFQYYARISTHRHWMQSCESNLYPVFAAIDSHLKLDPTDWTSPLKKLLRFLWIVVWGEFNAQVLKLGLVTASGNTKTLINPWWILLHLMLMLKLETLEFFTPLYFLMDTKGIDAKPNET